MKAATASWDHECSFRSESSSLTKNQLGYILDMFSDIPTKFQYPTTIWNRRVAHQSGQGRVLPCAVKIASSTDLLGPCLLFSLYEGLPSKNGHCKTPY